MLKLIIPFAPVTKKNSPRILINKKTGRPFLLPSEKYVEYEKKVKAYIANSGLKIDTINYRVNVKCLFYMPTLRRCDLTNLLEGIDDALVAAGILEDDNYNVIASHDKSRVKYDKENPRTEVYISLFEEEEKE